MLQYVEAHGRVTRREAAELCGISGNEATHLLRRLASANALVMKGHRRGAYYERTSK